MSSAETVIRERGLRIAEVGVEKDNPDARRLYERLGYTLQSELREQYSYTTPDGVHASHLVDQWILHKQL
jgi:ribosomal protein S18 acetylase RimI-like enzyme